jgi:hypothetical protein
MWGVVTAGSVADVEHLTPALSSSSAETEETNAPLSVSFSDGAIQCMGQGVGAWIAT